MSPAERGEMKDYDVVLAASARAFLLELEREERESLMRAIWEELRPDISPAVGVTDKIRRREICGYYVDYRNLQDTEKKRFDLRNGKLLVTITPVVRHFWDWFGLGWW